MSLLLGRCVCRRCYCLVKVKSYALGLAISFVARPVVESAPAGRFELLGVPVCVVGQNRRLGEAFRSFNDRSMTEQHRKS